MRLGQESEQAAKLLPLVRCGSIEQLDEHLSVDPGAIHCTDKFGNSLLHVACQSGNKRAVKFCLRKGLDVDARNADGQTPLHHCFALGHSALAAYLTDKGADDSLRNAAGLTPYEGTRLHDDSPAEERVGHFRR
jgi:ankyrin repeat protein